MYVDFEERCYVKHQSIFVVIKTTSKENRNLRTMLDLSSAL